MTAYILLIASVFLSVFGYLFKQMRLVLAGISMIMMGAGCGLIFSMSPSIWGLLLVVVSLFQILNIARLVDGRLHSKYLKAAFFIGGARLLALQLLLIGVDRLLDSSDAMDNALLRWFPVFQAIVAIVVFMTVLARLFASRPKNVKSFLSDRELPTLSVLVPARNEDQNLEELLQTIIANDYPKLEILVLDDCSTGKNISDVVKKFAKDGVRFIQGDAPKVSWLAKNQAYSALASQASGEWLIFMGVDVRLGIGSLRGIIHYAINNNKEMISVLPRRFNGAFWGGFFSPLRYFRELTKIGMRDRGVPALSTAWLIKKGAYQSLGGIESVARKIIPEHYFAKHLTARKTYAFIRTNDYLQFASAKELKEQIATSVRVIYPSLHRRMEWMTLSVIAMFVFLFMPFVELINNVNNGQFGLGFFASLVAVICLTSAHLLITTLTNPILWPLAVINFPYLVIQEIVLSIVSMYRYEFGEIFWKGRNICLPVMHVEPHLPPMSEN